MAEQVSLEDVGQAEMVLARLIQERKSLENAGKVLQTYRMVKTELQPALDALSDVQKKIEEAQQRLSNMQAQEKVALDKMEKNIVAYENKRGSEVEKNITALSSKLEELEKAYAEQSVLFELSIKGYEESIEASKVELGKVEKMLSAAKSEHGVLAEAVSKAAQMFIGESR